VCVCVFLRKRRKKDTGGGNATHNIVLRAEILVRSFPNGEDEDSDLNIII